MDKLVEYFDRLPYEKIQQLRAVIGTGELNWGGVFHRLPKEKKLEVGRITFGCEVKNVRMEFERSRANGFNIPVIIAEAARPSTPAVQR